MPTAALFLDDVKRKKAALWALLANLACLHIWFSIMIWAVVTKKSADYDTGTMKIMITAVIGSMGINVLLLISNDALNIVFALLSKWLGIVPVPAQAGMIEEITSKKTVVTP